MPSFFSEFKKQTSHENKERVFPQEVFLKLGSKSINGIRIVAYLQSLTLPK